MPPQPLLELRREALDPAEEADVVDRDPAVGEHALEVAVADRELQVPPDRPEDQGSRRPGSGSRGTPGRRSWTVLSEGMMAGAPLLPAHGPPLNATEPFREPSARAKLRAIRCSTANFRAPLHS